MHSRAIDAERLDDVVHVVVLPLPVSSYSIIFIWCWMFATSSSPPHDKAGSNQDRVEIPKHLRSFLPYVVPRLRKNEIWRQLYIQHNYVVYYYICVDADRQDSFAVRVLTRRWDDTRAELLLHTL